jgi:peroxiredoxin
MISEGVEAPRFELPAVVDGEVTTVDLGEFIGDEIVVLAFYPADFSPACTESASDLREFELFTMQKDVEAFAISTDSVYSHRGFADHYDLTMALLADTNREVVDAYDLHFEDEYGQRLMRRAVAVVDHNGVIRYTWAAEDVTTTPDIDAVRAAIGDIASDPTALARYRVGHAHYVEGRRAFTSAMGEYESKEWTLAQGDFEQSFDEFDEAASQFDSTIRFADDPDLQEIGQLSKEKASALKRAADWLGKSANAHSNGQGELAQGYQADAEKPLSTAREISEPPEPAAITIDENGTAHVHDTMERTERSGDRPPWADEDNPDVEQSEVDAIEQAVVAAEEEMEAAAEEETHADAETDDARETNDDDGDEDPTDDAVTDDGPAVADPMADTTDDDGAAASADAHGEVASPDAADEPADEEPVPEEIDLADPDPGPDESESDGMGSMVQPTNSIDVKRNQSDDGTLAPSDGGTNSLEPDSDEPLAPDDADTAEPPAPGGVADDPLAPTDVGADDSLADDAGTGDGDALDAVDPDVSEATSEERTDAPAERADDANDQDDGDDGEDADDPIELDLTDPNEG